MQDYIVDFINGTILDFVNSLDELSVILTKDFQGTKMWEICTASQSVIRPICYTLLILFFYMEMMRMMFKYDTFKWESVMFMLAKFCLAKASVDVLPELLNLLYSTVSQWIDGLLASSTSVDTANFFKDLRNILDEQLDDLGIFEMIGVVFTSFMQLLVVSICGIIVKVIAYGRMFEMFVAYATSPILCALMFDGEGQGNTAKRGVMDFFAICLQGFLIILVVKLWAAFVLDELSAMTAASSGSIWDVISVLLLGAVLLVMCIARCGQWAKKIVNVG